MNKKTYLYPNCEITIERTGELPMLNPGDDLDAPDVGRHMIVSRRVTGVLTNGYGKRARKVPKGWIPPPKLVVGEPFDLHRYVPELAGEAVPTHIDKDNLTGMMRVEFEMCGTLAMAGDPLRVSRKE